MSGSHCRDINPDLHNSFAQQTVKDLSPFTSHFSRKNPPQPSLTKGGRRVAFTLAEVLITLGIIGVVAALTIPALIAHHQEKVTVTKLKKAYSILSQAYQRAVDDNGAPEGWGLGDTNDPQGAENIYKKLSPYLSIVKDCGTGPGCFYSGIYKKVNKKNNWANIDTPTAMYGMYKFLLSDGMSIYIQSRDAECKEGSDIGLTPAARSICAFIGVDINGTNKPNALGSDLFIFLLTSHGLFPRGNSAIPSGVSSFEEQCLDKTSNGWACAAWVIYNENLDYLHCDDLSWNGKIKCK